MTDEERIKQLLDELMSTSTTPEEVCSEYPQFLRVVRLRWGQIRRLEAELDVLFPAKGGRPPREPELPQIPGYAVESVLGRGGMGIIFRAVHQRLNRPVALKMILAGAYAVREERTRFIREAEAVAALHHPNIVEVYDAGDLDGRPYYTMELVEGGNLAQKIAGVPQPVRSAAELVATLARAVHLAHQSGIVHRDLKPANVLLTPDGTPKVTDFGLARKIQWDGITVSGSAIGTPSYMAPEQARVDHGTIGPATDIYALGAILYELLTGRPPFRGETPAATIHQLLTDDPVHPMRLNRAVPRDLDTICLKGLQKDAKRRYASAGDLADDLDRFLRSEPIRARRIGLGGRLIRFARRRPGASSLIVAAAVIAITLPAVAVRVGAERAAAARAAEEALLDAQSREHELAWTRAADALDLAAARLGEGGPKELRARLASARGDVQLGMRLDRIRMSRASIVDGDFNTDRADSDYETAFRGAGLGGLDQPASVVAARIRASRIRDALVAALDDWTVCATDSRREWVLEVARLTDPDPWRDRVRAPLAWMDVDRLGRLARDATPGNESVPLLMAVSQRVLLGGGDAESIVRPIQAAHPADFWVNLTMGNALLYKAPAEASGFYRAAIASRPDAAVGYYALGQAFKHEGRTDLAIDNYRAALVLDPDFAQAHALLADLLCVQGHLDEAVEEYRKAIKIDPNFLTAQLNLGATLGDQGKMAEAAGHFQQTIDAYSQALKYNPDPEVRFRLGLAYQANGQLQNAVDQYQMILTPKEPAPEKLTLTPGATENTSAANRKVLAEHYRQAQLVGPRIAEVHLNLALTLYTQCKVDDALEQCRQAVQIDPNSSVVHVSFADILRAVGRSDEALKEYRQAVQLDPANPIMQDALARSLFEAGRLEEARAALTRLLTAVPETDKWHGVVSARLDKCKRMIDLQDQLPDILNGAEPPLDAEDCLSLAMLCHQGAHYTKAAELARRGFESAPQLANRANSRDRYVAACDAALAGCGQGDDAASLTGPLRAQWRAQSLKWLRAELSSQSKLLSPGKGADRIKVTVQLTTWRTDPSLAEVRDPAAWQKLSADEQTQWLAFWSDVRSLISKPE